METWDTGSPEEAMARWLEALRRRGESRAVAAAFHEAGRVVRCGVGELVGEVVEEIVGRENIGRWMALTPEGVDFALQGKVEAVRDEDGAGYGVVYRLTAGNFENRGRWRFRTGPQGLLMWVKHIPEQPAGMTTREVRDPNATWRTYARELPVGHSHDHDPH